MYIHTHTHTTNVGLDEQILEISQQLSFHGPNVPLTQLKHTNYTHIHVYNIYVHAYV